MTIVIKTFVTLLMLLSLGDADTGNLTAEGVARFEAGELDEAQVTLTTAIETDDTDHVAQAYLGRIAMAQERADDAIVSLEKAVALDAENSMYHTWLGRAYLAKMQTVQFMEKGKYVQKTLGNLNRAVELDGSNIEARTILAHYYAKAPVFGGGDPAKSKEQIEAIKQLDPETGAALEAELF